MKIFISCSGDNSAGVKLHTSLSTVSPAPIEQLQRTLLNAVKGNWMSRRDEFKMDPIDPSTNKRRTFNAWIQSKLTGCRISQSKLGDPDVPLVVRLEMDTYDVAGLLGLDRYHGQDEDEVKVLFAKWLLGIAKPLGWYVPEIKSSRRIGLAAFFRPLKYRPISVVPAFLYHFSRIENKQRILAKGLIPRKGDYSTDFMYPPRVHLLSEFDPEYVRDLADSIHAQNSGQDIESLYHDGAEGSGLPIVVFKIATSKLRKGTQFYRDPSVKDGIWTYTHIPAAAISVLHEDTIHE